ncbi:hypothetical protein SAY87_012101 [Trapa incisa]|uniref:Wax synthase domain-containing protein n=1 Tax=Trapa incisa TaxID=236973 RepID=A0AAN7GPT5_9MYRT|nr:hypothetical protein SAY87_012101 [Trapa incisa]
MKRAPYPPSQPRKYEMDGEELMSFLKVWASTAASLSYSYSIAGSVPKGLPRFLCLLPVFYLLATLPLGLSTFHLRGPTALFLVWLCSFKLLLFCFDAGPLSQSPSCIHFVLVASLPIRIKQNDHHHQHAEDRVGRPKEMLDSLHDHRKVLSTAKVLLLALLFQAYNYKPHLPACVLWVLYCLHAYLEFELMMALYAIPARVVLGGLGFELEPQFKEPYLTTSLEDFWGRRWNLAVSGILRLAVYDPMRNLCIPIMGSELGSHAGVFSAFAVSGLMHEALFYYYYYTMEGPTWEVTAFFLIQGACVVAEKAVKKRCQRRISWRPHRLVAGALTLGFLSATGIPLFALPLMRNGIDEKLIREGHEMAVFLKERARLIIGSTGREISIVS